MSDEEFSLALGMGVVTGARSFKIDALGRLTGINYAQVWLPGENTAECRAASSVSMNMPRNAVGIVREDATSITYQVVDDTYTRYSLTGINAYSTTTPGTHQVTVAKTAPVDKKKAHSLSGCSHGFYGYYDGSNDYYTEGYVSGVVEGYGETIIGTRGFRCMKAKLVALSIDSKVKTPLRRLVQRNYKDVPQFEKFTDMVKAFPTDAGESAITPDTDAEFWTRSI